MGGDILDEGFETPGYENSWTEDVTGGTIDDANQDVARPTGGGDYVLKLVKASGDYDAMATFNNGSEEDVTYTTFYVQVNAEGLGNGNLLRLASGRDAGNAEVWRVELYDSGGTPYFRLRLWYTTGGGPDVSDQAGSSVTLDQWYRIDVKYDKTGGTWEWRIDETPEGSGSNALADGVQYWRMGELDDYTLTAYFDLYNVDSTGYVSFGAATQTISSTGNIVSLEGFGTHKANFGLSPSAIASLEGFGTHEVQLRTLVASAIASEEAFGAHTLGAFLVPSAIASLEAIGTPQLNMILTPSSIASGEGFGTAKFLLKLLPSGIASLEALGTPQLNFGISPSAIASLEAFGTHSVARHLHPTAILSLEALGTPELQWVLGPSGISSLEAFGSLSLALAVAIYPSGIGSSGGFGSPVFVKEIEPYTALSKEAFGDPELTYLNLGPPGIASLEGFGSHQVNLKIFGEAISSQEAFGTLSLATMASIYPDAIASLEALGTPFLYLINTVHPSAIGSLEAFGTPSLKKYLVPSAISSLEAVGILNIILAVQNIFPDGIPSGEAFGITQLISRLIRKAVAEAIGFKEKILRSSKEYSGGEDIIARILSNIWETTSSVSTFWETTKKVQKDE